MNPTLVALALLFSELSLLAFGGGNTVLPEMHRRTVDVYHWMTNGEFVALYALAQAAPGPNMMVVPLIGWHVAGWQGLLVSAAAIQEPEAPVEGISAPEPVAAVPVFAAPAEREIESEPHPEDLPADEAPSRST